MKSRLRATSIPALTLLLCINCISGISYAGSYKFKITQPTKPRIAIIIDDIGYNIPLGQRTVAIDGKLTLAVLPKTPGAIIIAKSAHKSGKEIMLHAPMSNHNNEALGPGGLTPDMDKQTFLDTLTADILSIPYVQGVNNHMGSELTTHKKQMTWVMEELKKRDLYFIDSLTNGASVAHRTARQHHIPAQVRDVFLDHDNNTAAIEAAFRKLIKISKRNGYAIGIGHPYPTTLSVLERLLPELEANNIELVHVSDLLKIKENIKLAHLNRKETSSEAKSH